MSDKFASPKLPDGFQTILGFMSAEEFTELELIEEPIDFIQEYETNLVSLSKKYQLEVHVVPASPYVSERGIPTELAFTIPLLSTTLI